MSVVDTAITRLQAIALSCTSVTIKAAPVTPPEDASILPLAIAHIMSGSGQADNATTARLLLTVNVDFHFSSVTLKSAYQQIDAIIPEYLQRLAGDPTLAGSVETINFPVNVRVQPATWNDVVTEMVTFEIPLKFLETPLT